VLMLPRALPSLVVAVLPVTLVVLCVDVAACPP